MALRRVGHFDTYTVGRRRQIVDP